VVDPDLLRRQESDRASRGVATSSYLGGRVRRWVERILVEVPARKPEPKKRVEADDDNDDDDVLDVPVRRRA